MNLAHSLQMFQGINAVGLGAWAALAFFNNCKAFNASTGATARTMGMALLSEAPEIKTPLSTRSISAPLVHRAALLWIMALQGLAAALLVSGTVALFMAGEPETGRALVNFGLCALCACWLSMLLGGLWFAYWIRQEGLQLTHLALQLWVSISFLVFNYPWQ